VRDRPHVAAFAAAGVFVAVAVAITVTWQLLGEAVTDIPLYRTYGERVAGGLVPYRDFAFEYPPGALPFLFLPALVTDSRRLSSSRSRPPLRSRSTCPS